MFWAHSLPPATPEGVPPPYSGEAPRPGKGAVAVRVIVVVLVLAAVAMGASRYLRLTALDDYRMGFALGSVWRDDGERADKCFTAVDRLYGQTPAGVWDAPGSGEFIVGCEDGFRGEPPVAWYGLRDRLFGSGGDD